MLSLLKYVLTFSTCVFGFAVPDARGILDPTTGAVILGQYIVTLKPNIAESTIIKHIR